MGTLRAPEDANVGLREIRLKFEVGAAVDPALLDETVAVTKRSWVVTRHPPERSRIQRFTGRTGLVL